ncbi:MAG: hypothetical protein ACI9G1_002368 [Pirellulaceae bacterium]|jgi:hypothetical protein
MVEVEVEKEKGVPNCRLFIWPTTNECGQIKRMDVSAISNVAVEIYAITTMVICNVCSESPDAGK